MRVKTSRHQHTFIMLLFACSILIFLDLGVFSLSFVFGAMLIMLTLVRTPYILRAQRALKYLLAFLLIALMSLFFSDFKLGFDELKLYIQTIYWFLLAVIVYNIYPSINKQKLSKWVFFSVLLLLILYVMGFRVGMSQNAVAFSVIICAPMGFFYIKKLWLKIIFAALLVFLMLSNGSRSGSAISLLQSGLLIVSAMPGFKKHIKATLITLATFAFFMFNDTSLSIVGNVIHPYNPRLGELMMDREHILRNDMSWLQRKAQVQKGKQIFLEHPILGIGYGKFSVYDVVIDESAVDSDRILRNIDNRSSHNTYISWLAETGILGFGVMMLFFINVFIAYWKNLQAIVSGFEMNLFIAFIGMLIYFYTISAGSGTSTWIMFGIIAAGSRYAQLQRFYKT